MITRKLIAYGLIALIAVSLAVWAWRRERSRRRLREERHGPRLD